MIAAHPKLCLGTVQLGLKYGIRQRDYKPPTREIAAEILGVAARHQVSFIDTAFEYGESEQIIGDLQPREWDPKVITKTPKLREGSFFSKTGRWLEKAYDISCSDLKRASCYALLFHSPENLAQPGREHLLDAVASLRHAGRVAKIGISVYNAEQLKAAMDLFPFQIVQLPLSLADQRLLQDGTLRRLHDAGVEVHVRSAFLQGALLMSDEEIPRGMNGLRPALAELEERCAAASVLPAHALLQFVLSLNEVDAVVVGVNRPEHLSELCTWSNQTLPPGFDQSPLPVADDTLLNPATWAKRINI